MSHAMAFSRQLLWVRRSIWCPPAPFPAASRLPLLRNWTLKQNVRLLSPLNPRNYRSKRIGPNRFGHLPIVAIHSEQGRLETYLNGKEGGDQTASSDEVPKPSQKRRRRRKGPKDTSSNAISGGVGKEEALAEEVRASGSQGPLSGGGPVGLRGQEVVDVNVVTGEEDDTVSPASRMVGTAVLTEAALAAEEVNSKTSELESRGLKETSKKKRPSRSRKKGTSNALPASDKIFSGSETDSESSNRTSTISVSVSDAKPESGTPALDINLDSDSARESNALDANPIATLDADSANNNRGTGGGAGNKIKQNKISRREAAEQNIGNSSKDENNSTGGDDGHFATPNMLVNDTSESAGEGVLTDHQTSNDQPITTARKRRGRRKKNTTVDNNPSSAADLKVVNGRLRPGVLDVDQGTLAKLDEQARGQKHVTNEYRVEPRDSTEASGVEHGNGSWDGNLQSNAEGNVSEGVASFGPKGKGEGENLEIEVRDEIKALGTAQIETEWRPLDDSTLQREAQGSVNEGVTSFGANETGGGEALEGRSDDEMKISNLQSEANSHPSGNGQILDSVPADEAKPAKRSRRKRQRKKRASESLPVELTSGQAEQSANDPLNAVIWCTVKLKVQANLEQNEFLFVAGANPEFGGWDLSLALELIESEEGFLENSVKIPRGTMLEYKYFLEVRDADSTVTDRLFGPEIQYFLPWRDGEGSDFEQIRDIWVPDIPKNLPLLSWGDRWWEELDSAESGNEAADLEKEEADVGYQDANTGENVILDYVEPLVAVESSKVEIDSSQEWLKKKSRRKKLPREEPWLLESMLLEQRKTSLRRKTEEAEPEDELVRATVVGDTEQKEPAVQVEILINSPQCTMQRVAILEDRRLVELLIEPVTTRVQVGNIYLGVVKQLLPGMNGVFVDIGSFQLALLDITRNQYPYTFPSIAQSTRDPSDTQPWNLFDDEDDSDWDDADSEDEELDDDGDDEEDEDEEEDDEVIVEDDENVEGERTRTEEEAEGGNGSVSGGYLVVKSPGLTSSQNDSAEAISYPAPRTVNFGRKLKKWRRLQEGMQIIVQVKKEALGKKGPRLTAFPSLAGRFWVLIPGGQAVGVSRRITGPERKRLRKLARDLLPENFALTVRTEALGHDREDLEKDLARLMETWKGVLECASAAAVAADHGMEGVPVLLHRAMGQTLSLVRDFFTDRVQRMVIDSAQCYQEVTSYLQEVAPQLSDRVELYTDKTPIFDAFDIESEIEKFSNKRVSLPNGGYLVIEETEALVSIDVNGGSGVLSQDVFQEEANLAVNLAAARQIALELRLRDIGGIIVVDFIDMEDQRSQELVMEEMRKATSRDRSSLSFSEISEFGLMQITRRRVRKSVTLMISNPCSHCGGVGRVEAHEATLSRIERALLRLLATRPGQTDTSDDLKWPQITLRVDSVMGEYLKGRKRKRLTQLSAALKVWLHLKVAMELGVGHFQLLEQHRSGIEKRPNGSGQAKANQQNSSPGLLGKRGVLPAKRRRNFFNQASSRAP